MKNNKGYCCDVALVRTCNKPHIPITCIIWRELAIKDRGGSLIPPSRLRLASSSAHHPYIPHLLIHSSIPFPLSTSPTFTIFLVSILLPTIHPSIHPFIHPFYFVLSLTMCLCLTDSSCLKDPDPTRHPQPPWRTSYMLPDMTSQLSNNPSSRIHCFLLIFFPFTTHAHL
jgi:hypothetical protein